MTYGQLAYGEWIAARSATGLNTPAWDDIMEDERYQWERVGSLAGKCGENGGIAPDGQMVVGSIAFAPKVP
jgi:hypothetical protein